MKVWVLGSGSRGNAVLIEADGGRVLVDAGFSVSVLAARLNAIGVAPESIESVVLTHEHKDHSRCVATGSARWGWSVYATAGTARATGLASLPDCRAVAREEPIALQSMDVSTFPIAHDAVEPVGIVVTARRTGARAAVVYDLGVATPEVTRVCHGVDILVLEANHDEAMLRSGPYTATVKQRIASRNGHLSNRAAARCARDVVHSRLSHVVLAHLSEACNAPSIAARTVTEGMKRASYSGSVHVARQHEVVGPFAPRHRAHQLALLL
ncbi:MAG: MBL fold metallo-hydrolase [Gemmatimonadaceae bacterium]